MNYLLDTCVLSELRKNDADPRVLEWIGKAHESRLYLSVITLGEIEKGIAKLGDSKKKQDLRLWLEQDLVERFGERVLAVDAETALAWGRLLAQAERRGRSVPVVDCLIAATAAVNNLAVVTRNTADFEGFPVNVVDPWA